MYLEFCSYMIIACVLILMSIVAKEVERRMK